MPFQHSAHRHGNGAGLLGHHHHHRVGDFTGAQGSMVPGTQFLGHIGILGQGHHASGKGNPAVLDDHGAVMQGGIVEKDITQQLLRHQCIDLGAGFVVFVQMLFPGKHDQGAHLFLAHDLTGPDGLGDHGVYLLDGLGGTEDGTQPHGAQVVQHPPQFRLEQHHKGQQSDGQQLAEQPVQGIKMQFAGCHSNQHQQHNRAGQAHHMRRANQRQ